MGVSKINPGTASRHQRRLPSATSPRTYSYTLSEMCSPASQHLSSQKTLWPYGLDEEAHNTSTNSLADPCDHPTKNRIIHNHNTPTKADNSQEVLYNDEKEEEEEEEEDTSRNTAVTATTTPQAPAFKTQLLALLSTLPPRSCSTRRLHVPDDTDDEDTDSTDDGAQLGGEDVGSLGKDNGDEGHGENEEVTEADDSDGNVMSKDGTTSSYSYDAWIMLPSTTTATVTRIGSTAHS